MREANRRDTVATVALNLVSGIFTGYALLATAGVLRCCWRCWSSRNCQAAVPQFVRSELGI
jgi:hypothetical protein